MTVPDVVPRGTLRPRARFETDARVLTLDGVWAARWSDSPAAAPDDLTDADLDTSGWDAIPVPSSWPMHGRGAPWYTNKRYPFPLDPPFVPDANQVGDHAVRFEWTPGERTVLRIDGVDAAGDVVLNGIRVGSTRGSRLVHEFDITRAVRSGTNLLVIRVAQWAASSYLEDQDMWWLPGVFRSVAVLDRPAGGIEDLRVHTAWADGIGTLRVDVDGSPDARVRVPELGIDIAAGEAVEVAAAPWSADSPRLYDLIVATPAETARLRVGFRTIRIDGVRLLANGHPLLLRGVNRHEHHPDLGRVVPADVVHDELLLMKQHNINAIRTAHYPPHPDLPALADELGFWLMVECDFETHGFELDGWRGNPTDDPAYEEALRDRMARTVERDRNHPSVFMWSLGNESGSGRNLAAMADESRRRDPSRPLHYEGDRASADVDVYSRMYPYPSEVALIARGEEDPLDDPVLDARRRSMPFIMCEYVHAMGNGPGSLADYQALMESSPRMAGGFVWEWVEHGIRRRTPDGREYYAYGGDFGEPVHDGIFVADGLVDADRRPRPGLADVARVFAPVRFTIGDDAVTVENLHDTVDLDGLRGEWSLSTGGAGELPLPELAPGTSGVVTLPPEARGPGLLTVRAVLDSDRAWAPRGHVVAWAQRGALPVTPAPAASVAPSREGRSIRLGPAVIDALTGRLSIAGRDLHGPELVLWRAPTDNDLGGALSDPSAEIEPDRLDATRWDAAGLRHLQSRLIGIDLEPGAVVVRTRVAPEVFAWGVLVETRYESDGDAVGLAVRVEPDGAWPCTWARVGLRFHLPSATGAEWSGLGPGPAYPDTGMGQALGTWSAPLADLRTEYVRPQASGSRSDVTALEIGGLRFTGDGFAFTANPWTDAELAAAAHPTDLPVPSEGCWLTIDVAQHGIGTAACGPGVLAPYRLEPHTVEGRLAIRALDGA